MRNTAPRRVNPARSRHSYTYIPGSAAPAYREEDYSYKPRRPKKRTPRPAPVSASFTRYHERMNPSLRYVLVIATVLGLCSLGLLSINENISQVKSEIRATEALTEKTRSVNEQLENMLSEAVDMDEVKRTATTKLGMQSAAPHQIVNINVEKDSYSVQYDDQVANARKKTLLERLGLK